MRIIVAVTLFSVPFCVLGRAADPDEGASKLTPAKIEEKVLGELNAGRQWKAEELLHNYAAPRYPQFPAVAGLVEEDKTAEAKALWGKQPAHSPGDQRVLFLLGALRRSRFDIAGSYRVMAVVAVIDPNSVAGQCATLVTLLDAKEPDKAREKTYDKEAGEHFAALAKLADANPDDIMIRWMLAVQCRTYERNAEGVGHYKKMLQKWNPGPILVHQTYANLLDELKRYDEALVERRKAVEMEPAPWSLDGLGNTLGHLGRFQESYEAHAQAVALQPSDPSYLRNWAVHLRNGGRYDEAIAKCKMVFDIDPNNRDAHHILGECLDLQGKKQDALRAYDAYQRAGPKDDWVSRRGGRLLHGFEPLPRPLKADPEGKF